ncbi:hypothetical protein ABZ619_28555 [Streptomyces sp. NPDC007851]|uniref:hypothetical protein n=1 Tax=Streptomyces sp. NPDC007851 TaxID=3155008 RepID=UPI0033EC12A8
MVELMGSVYYVKGDHDGKDFTDRKSTSMHLADSGKRSENPKRVVEKDADAICLPMKRNQVSSFNRPRRIASRLRQLRGDEAVFRQGGGQKRGECLVVHKY